MNAQHEIQHSKPEQICSLSHTVTYQMNALYWQELSNRHQIQIADIFVFAFIQIIRNTVDCKNSKSFFKYLC